MSTVRSRKLTLIALLVLWAAACTQASRAPVTPRSSATPAAAAAPVFRFAAYGDTRDGHDVHHRGVAGALSFPPSLVLQTRDPAHHASAADQSRILGCVTCAVPRR